MAETILWKGATGAEYKYYIYSLPHSGFKAEPGNYVFAKETESSKFRPIYAGETEDLSERFDNHHAMPCIQSNGATHITAHTNAAGDQARRDEEKDLRDNYNPVCNKQ